MPRFLPVLIAGAFLFSGCGYVGNPLPPLANVPARITDLAAVQRDGRIIVHFKLPKTTTESVEIKAPLKMDVRIGKADGPFVPALWSGDAKPAPPGEVADGVATVVIPSGPWTGQQVTIAARVVAANGKESDWVALDALPVVAPPEKPLSPKAESSPGGLRVTWEGGPGDFRIFRRGPDEKAFAPVAEVQQLNWTDPASEVGKQYTYIVQRIVKLGIHKEAESDQSAEALGILKDTFAPAAPTGLKASPAAASVELFWERSPEADLAGYRVYRAVGAGPFEKIAEVSQVPSYSDRNVRSGEHYRYAITAFDRSANESERSTVVEASVQ